MESFPKILAPLAGYTDKAFREIAASFGADRSVTEMVSAEGLARNSRKSKELLEKYPGEENLIIQIFAYSKDQVERAIPNLLSYQPKEIDINSGCPVNKVIKTGAGAALMKNPKEAAGMVRILRESGIENVSVKFRLGWDSSSINYISFAEEVVKAGALTLTLHARTRSALYSGKADWNAFRELKRALAGSPVKLFASGDIFKAEDAVRVVSDYGVDGVMVARGSIGNPFIFRQINEMVETGSYSETKSYEKISAAVKHLSLAVSYYGEERAVKEMRKHILAYIKGLENIAGVKNKILKAKTEQETAYFLLEYLNSPNNPSR